MAASSPRRSHGIRDYRTHRRRRNQIGGSLLAGAALIGRKSTKTSASKTFSPANPQAKANHLSRNGSIQEMARELKQSAKVFRRRKDAEERFLSVYLAVQAILRMPAEVSEPLRKRLLHCCLWQLGQSQAIGKYNLRFVSAEAQKRLETGDNSGLVHEHVHTRDALVRKLLKSEENPERIERILRRSHCCVVTAEEHQLLHKHDGSGWKRYKIARIEVIDRSKE